MYEDAVQRALRVDLALAQQVAGSPPEEDAHLRHRLWLAVAQHVVQVRHNNMSYRHGIIKRRTGTARVVRAGLPYVVELLQDI
jgi:hypothetical protein